MKVIPLSEGTFTIDKTKEFISFDLTKDNLQERTKGSLLVEIQPFAVITSRDIIVIDTGLGFTNSSGQMQIHENLKRNGINPADVTKVLLSHLHKDHAGGIAHTVSGEKKLSFPNAKYHVNALEFREALKKDNPSFKPEQFEILEGSPNVILTEDNGVIDDYIRYELTGAHSPFHQVFWIIEDGKKIFFGGDVAPQLQQMKSRFVAKYDFDGKKCMELRTEWKTRGEIEKWTFLFYHDIKSPVVEF